MANLSKLTKPQQNLYARVLKAHKAGKALDLFTASDRKVAKNLTDMGISDGFANAGGLVDLEVEDVTDWKGNHKGQRVIATLGNVGFILQGKTDTYKTAWGPLTVWHVDNGDDYLYRIHGVASDGNAFDGWGYLDAHDGPNRQYARYLEDKFGNGMKGVAKEISDLGEPGFDWDNEAKKS